MEECAEIDDLFDYLCQLLESLFYLFIYFLFSRREYWSGLPFPSPGDLPDPGIKPGSPALEADALTSEPSGKI